MTAARFASLALMLGALLAARPAHATFHFMQVEQIIAGVDGSTATQAIQLRMRSASQNLVSQATIRAWDANGQNPVVLLDLLTNVSIGSAGSHVLIATANFSSATSPSVTPDFILTNPIPDSYIPAGSLTFESDFGTIYWRVSWGGASYTGATTGSTTNDTDGNFGPPFAGPLPTGSGQALRFTGSASALSTSNAANYAVTTGSAVFTNNAGNAGSINSLIGVPGSDAPAIALGHPFPNPAYGAMTFFVSLPRTMHIKAAIYDVAGRRIVPLVDGIAPAGRSSYSWDALDPGGGALTPGVYFVGLEAGGVKRTQRFVLVGRGIAQEEPHEHE
jgi:hypothetical protein